MGFVTKFFLIVIGSLEVRSAQRRGAGGHQVHGGKQTGNVSNTFPIKHLKNANLFIFISGTGGSGPACSPAATAAPTTTSGWWWTTKGSRAERLSKTTLCGCWNNCRVIRPTFPTKSIILYKYLYLNFSGYIVREDVSNVLRNQGYWPSYNTPYFKKIFRLSGAPENVKK